MNYSRRCLICAVEIKEGTYCDPCADKLIENNNREQHSAKYLQYEYVKGYGKVLKSRLDELGRRVVLPYKKGNPGEGQYYLGRVGENGKIQERHPDYF